MRSLGPTRLVIAYLDDPMDACRDSVHRTRRSGIIQTPSVLAVLDAHQLLVSPNSCLN